MEKIRIVVFGQQAARDLNRLSVSPDLDISIITSEPLVLLRAIIQHKPHVVLIEVVPVSDEAISLIDQIQLLSSSIKCIVLAHELDTLHVRQAVNAGIMGYFLLEDDPEQLIVPIQLTHTGKFTCSPEVTAVLTATCRQTKTP